MSHTPREEDQRDWTHGSSSHLSTLHCITLTDESSGIASISAPCSEKPQNQHGESALTHEPVNKITLMSNRIGPVGWSRLGKDSTRLGRHLIGRPTRWVCESSNKAWVPCRWMDSPPNVCSFDYMALDQGVCMLLCRWYDLVWLPYFALWLCSECLSMNYELMVDIVCFVFIACQSVSNRLSWEIALGNVLFFFYVC